MSFVIISGILISQVVFPNIQVANQGWFHTTHISVSYFVLLLVGIHIGLHWQWVVNVWKKIWRLNSNHAWGRYAARILTALVPLFGVYEIKNAGFVNQLSGVTSVFGATTQNMQGHDGGPDFHGPRDGMGPDDGMGPGGGRMNANSTASSTQSAQQSSQANLNTGQDFRAEMKHGDGGQVNFLGVIATYTGIMAVFAIITYYLKKLTGRKKKKRES